MDIIGLIKSFGEVFTSFLNYFTTAKKEQCETQIIKDKNRLKAATDIAEQIFTITDNYKEFFMADHTEMYNKLRKKFDRKD